MNVKHLFVWHENTSKMVTLLLTLVLFISTIQSQERNGLGKIVTSGDGQVIAVNYPFDNRFVNIIDLFDGETNLYLESVDTSPYSILDYTISPDGNKIVYSSTDGSVYLYSRKEKTNTVLRGAGGDTINLLAYNPVYETIAIVSGATVEIRDISNFEVLVTTDGEGRLIFDVSWSLTGNKILTLQSVTDDIFSQQASGTQVKLWSLEDNLVSLLFQLDTSEIVSDAAINEIDNQIAYVRESGFTVVDVETKLVITRQEADFESLYVVSWNPAVPQLATGGQQLVIWDTSTWQPIKQYSGETLVDSLAWSNDGQAIFHNGNFETMYRNDIPLSIFSYGN